MPDKKLSDILATTEPENSSGGVKGHSNTGASQGAPTPDVLIAQLMEENRRLSESLAQATKTNSSSDFNKLVDVFTALLDKREQPDTNNHLNTTDNFNEKNNVDGRGLMAAQESLMKFKQENLKPINVPQSMRPYVGPHLTVTVNGVRIAVPCDGKTYYINAIHWEHIMERMSKLNALNAKSSVPDVKNVS